MPALPRGTCLACRKDVAMRNTGTLREHAAASGLKCPGSNMRPLESLEAEPDTITLPERDCRRKGETGKVYVGRRHPAHGFLMVTIDLNGKPIGSLCHYVKHSPTGFECGYGGSGPADLARCLLIDHKGLQSLAERESVIPGVDRHYQDFKAEVVAGLDPTGFELPAEKIDEWLRGRS